MPINALTMSLNIRELFPEHLRHKKWVVIIINLICVIPAVLIGGFVRCLGVIIEFSGLFGYLLMIAPAACCYKATLMCERELPDSKCPFSTPLSHKAVMIVLIAINVIGLVVTIYSLIYGLVVG